MARRDVNDNVNWTVIAALVGVVLAPFLTYLVAKRVNSGKVADTDANTLWKASETMREENRVRAEKLEVRLEVVQKKLDDQTVTLNEIRDKVAECQNENRLMRQEMEAWRLEAERLRRKVVDDDDPRGGEMS